MMHLNDPIPDPRKLRSDIPAELVRILNKALAKDRQQRYQDANAFGHDLRRLLTSLESQTSTTAAAMEDTQTPTIIPQPSQRAAVQNLSGAKTNIDAATVYDQRQPPATNNFTPPPPVPPGPVSGSYPQPFEPEKKRLPKWIFAVGGVVFLFVVAIVIGGVYFLSNQFGASAASGNSTQQAALAATMTQVAFLAQPTQTETATATERPSPTATEVVAALPTNTSFPTATDIPLPTNTPTATLPTYYVRINNITITSSNYYQVDYETFGFTEQLPGMHIHFFFNTVPPDQAGVPGSGPWYLYGGPRPFTGYAVNQRPAGATQMCALVANSNHTVIQGSGNCYDLP